MGDGVSEGGTATDSYWDTQTSGRSTSDDGIGLLSRQLKRPVAYATIYENWNVDLDGDPDTNDDPWDFGGPRDYPLLKVDFNGDGEATWQEFGDQYRAGPARPPSLQLAYRPPGKLRQRPQRHHGHLPSPHHRHGRRRRNHLHHHL